MATRALDYAGGDRPTVFECGWVVEVGALGEQVVGAAVSAGSLVGLETESGGLAADRGGDGAGLSVEDRAGFVAHPALGAGIAFVKEAPGRPPQIFVSRDTLQHVREVLPCEVQVTDHAHPLCGRVLWARGFRRLKGVLMLAVVLPDGSAGTIAAEATSVLGEEPRSGPAPPLGAEPVLTVDGVRRLRALSAAKSRGPEDRGTRRRAA